MLSPKVDTLIRDSIEVYLKAQGYRPSRFGQRLLAQSFAGQTIQPAKVAAVTAKEIEAVSIGLVIAIKSVIEKFQINPYEGLESDLLAVFDSEFDKCAEAVEKFGRDTFTRLRANGAPSNWFTDRLEDARKARHVEIKLLAAEISKSNSGDTNRVLYNSDNEPVGIVDSDP